ncbi:MAG: EAL domain-containing protein [Chloroflexi bacterium]|nr:EAL domain-containing protein [Chloroflexota bacterium]
MEPTRSEDRAAPADSTFGISEPPTGLPRAGRWAWSGLALVLTCLTAYSVWVAFMASGMTSQVKQAQTISSAYQEARRAVLEEEGLEREYRLEPSAATRAELTAEAAVFGRALAGILSSSAAADQQLGSRLTVLHADYVAATAEMMAAVDRGDTEAVRIIDVRTERDLAQIETDLTDAATARVLAVEDDMAALAMTVQGAIQITPVIFLGGFLVLLVLRIALRTYDRRIREGHGREIDQARHNEHRFRSLVQNAADIILILDEAGRVRYQSPSAEGLWGHADADIQGQTLIAFVDPEEGRAAEELLGGARAAPGTDVRSELGILFADGAFRRCETIVRNLLGEPGVDGIVATLRDVTDRRRLEAELTRMAFRDSLTGLANRALFEDRLELALQRAERHERRAGLLFIDLDNFKHINDALGHEEGDRALIAVARRIESALRGSDSAARLGGDEFTVLVDDVAEEADAEAAARRVTEELRLPLVVGGRDLVLTASVGIALSLPGDTPERFLRRADLAMYRAKTMGKAQSQLFDPSMEAKARQRMRMEGDLRQALEQGEFVTHYQPIVRLADASWVGFEALLRWRHPEDGLVLPGQFIPLAEELQLIVPMGQFVLEQAVGDLTSWHGIAGSTPPLRLSVNLSGRQFDHPGLVTDIERAVHTAGLDPCRLTLEITESTLMDGSVSARDKLHGLAALGIRIAIDDFGTGYSSLSRLRSFPVHALKIDRSFVTDLPGDNQAAAIVRNILALGQDLGMQVTAEGVETEDQRGALIDLGCELAQGYLFGRPVSAAETRLALRGGASRERAPSSRRRRGQKVNAASRPPGRVWIDPNTIAPSHQLVVIPMFNAAEG